MRTISLENNKILHREDFINSDSVFYYLLLFLRLVLMILNSFATS